MDFASISVREQSRALSEWMNGETIDQALLDRCGLSVDATKLTFRSMSSAGSATVPSGVYRGFQKAMSALNTVYKNATVIPTDGGGTLSIPTIEDDESGEIVSENAAMSGSDIDINNVEYGWHKYVGKTARLSNELLKDAIPEFMEELGEALADRIARLSNLHFTTGDGVGKPTGIVTGSMLGKTCASASAITFGDLLDLQHSVDTAYWPRSSFKMNSESFKMVRQLADPNGVPAYQSGLLLGSPVIFNPSMPGIAPAAKPVIFGALGEYVVRESGGLSIRRYAEKYAEFHQTGLAAILRLDGKLSVASAVKHLQMAV